MTKFLATAVVLVLALRWLALGTVTVTADGFPVAVPMLLVVAVVVVSAAATVVALLVYRTRAERAMLAAWRARHVAAQ